MEYYSCLLWLADASDVDKALSTVHNMRFAVTGNALAAYVRMDVLSGAKCVTGIDSVVLGTALALPLMVTRWGYVKQERISVLLEEDSAKYPKSAVPTTAMKGYASRALAGAQMNQAGASTIASAVVSWNAKTVSAQILTSALNI